MNPLSFVLGYLNFVTTHKRAKTWSVGSAATRVALRIQVGQFRSYKIRTVGIATSFVIWSWIVFAVTVWHFLLSFFLGLGCNLWICQFMDKKPPDSLFSCLIYCTTIIWSSHYYLCYNGWEISFASEKLSCVRKIKSLKKSNFWNWLQVPFSLWLKE